MTSTPQSANPPILITAGTGKSGRRIAARLQARGVATRIGSRSGRPAFDWADEQTWGACLSGVRAAYICFVPDLAVPSAEKSILEFSRRAVDAGVEHLVLLSGRGEDGAQLCEQVVVDSGAAWTLLRASWFAQNFSEAEFREPILAGDLALPVAEVSEPFLHLDDLADVAVAALLDRHHRGRVYELTGPRALTFAEAVATIAAAAGRRVTFTSVTTQDYAATLSGYGLPDADVQLLIHLFTTVLDGRNSTPTGDVEQVLARPPRDFLDYARQAGATGAWSA